MIVSFWVYDSVANVRSVTHVQARALESHANHISQRAENSVNVS